MEFTKKDIIQKLYELEETNNLKLGREVQKVIRSELIPLDVIKLINKYDKKFLQIYDTVNAIYKSRYRNPLYRNLKNKNLDTPEIAIAMSSFVTKILISCSKIKDEQERLIFSKAMNIDGINQALTEYAVFNKDEALNQCFNEVRQLLKDLFSD